MPGKCTGTDPGNSMYMLDGNVGLSIPVANGTQTQTITLPYVPVFFNRAECLCGASVTTQSPNLEIQVLKPFRTLGIPLGLYVAPAATIRTSATSIPLVASSPIRRRAPISTRVAQPG